MIFQNFSDPFQLLIPPQLRVGRFIRWKRGLIFELSFSDVHINISILIWTSLNDNSKIKFSYFWPAINNNVCRYVWLGNQATTVLYTQLLTNQNGRSICIRHLFLLHPRLLEISLWKLKLAFVRPLSSEMPVPLCRCVSSFCFFFMLYFPLFCPILLIWGSTGSSGMGLYHCSWFYITTNTLVVKIAGRLF